jgi:hypothetical protein
VPDADFAHKTLVRDDRLPDGTDERRPHGRGRRIESEKEREEARVAQVELRRLDQSVSDVAEPRLDEHDLIRRFEHRNPIGCRAASDADVACEVGHVEKLTGPERTGTKKPLEIAEASDS